MLKFKYKKYLLVISLFFSSLFAGWAQSGNLPYADEQFIHFGFSLGINKMDFSVGSNTVADSVGNLYSASVSSLTSGFSVGIISDMRLTRYLNLRFNPTLHLGERMISYYNISSDKDAGSTIIQSIPINLPLYIKWSAERKNNYRPYLLWGGGIGFDLATNEDIVLKPLNLYTEIGVGCDIYFSFFKLAPELKFAIGLNDIFDRDRSELDKPTKHYSLMLSKLTSRMITLSFNFE